MSDSIQTAKVVEVLLKFYMDARHIHETDDDDQDYAFHAMNCARSIAGRLGLSINFDKEEANA